MINNQCPIVCRFCTRKRKIGFPGVVTRETLRQGIEYIRNKRTMPPYGVIPGLEIGNTPVQGWHELMDLTQKGRLVLARFFYRLPINFLGLVFIDIFLKLAYS